MHPSLGNFVERHVEAVATKHGGEVWAPVAVGSGATNVLKMREKSGVEEREVYFHLLGVVEGVAVTIYGYYYGASKKD